MARTCPLSVARLASYGAGIFSSLVQTEPPSLLLVEAGLRDLRSSSTEHENVLLCSDRYKCSPHSIICRYPIALGKLLVEDHWRVLVSNISTVGSCSPMCGDVHPPATIRWAGVVAVAGLTLAVGIGGRSSLHFAPHPNKLPSYQEASELTALLPTAQPPTVVTSLFTIARPKRSFSHRGSLVHLSLANV